jgi:hypothetical protein
MAVGAQEHALAGLLPHPTDPPGHTLMTEVKDLGRPISMMKLKRCLMLVEPTDPTSPASLFDELPLDLPTAL